MYHAIVRRRLERVFAAINRGDYRTVVAEFPPRHRHVFVGKHALGGARTRIEDTREWYRRLAAIFPDLRFEVGSVLVGGWPWNTVATVEWKDHFDVNGTAESNRGVHVLRIEWGRVVELVVHCDTQKLADVLRRKAESGLAEASASPIGAIV